MKSTSRKPNSPSSKREDNIVIRKQYHRQTIRAQQHKITLHNNRQRFDMEFNRNRRETVLSDKPKKSIGYQKPQATKKNYLRMTRASPMIYHCQKSNDSGRSKLWTAKNFHEKKGREDNQIRRKRLELVLLEKQISDT